MSGSEDTPSAMSTEEMTRMLFSLSQKIDSLTADTGHDKPERESRKRTREEEIEDETLDDTDADRTALEESEGSGIKKPRTFLMSSPTKAFMKTSFCLPKPVENSTRRAWLEKFGLPDGDEARCPKMDSLIKGELGKETMEADKKLARLQNFTLDAAGPMAVALEELTSKDEPNGELVISAIQQSLMLIGNASAHFSKERRTKALEKLNPDLKSLAEEEDFSQAQPFLFGKGFEKTAKERAEALECLRKATTKDKKISFPSKTRPFRDTHPQRNGGYGGGGYQRNQYQTQNTDRKAPYYNKRGNDKSNGIKPKN